MLKDLFSRLYEMMRTNTDFTDAKVLNSIQSACYIYVYVMINTVDYHLHSFITRQSPVRVSFILSYAFKHVRCDL